MAVDSLDKILADIDAPYAARRKVVQDQQASLPGYYGQLAQSLDTAKANAFSGINDQANARGVFYSGAPIAEQQKYVGEKYLPALAGLKQNEADQEFKLTGALNDINSEKYHEATGIRTNQQKIEADQAAEAARLQLEREKMAASAARSSGGGRAPSAADKKASVTSEFRSDLQGAFQGFTVRPQFYTERVIIPKLQAAYPELSDKEIQDSVYNYRRLLGFG